MLICLPTVFFYFPGTFIDYTVGRNKNGESKSYLKLFIVPNIVSNSIVKIRTMFFLPGIFREICSSIFIKN